MTSEPIMAKIREAAEKKASEFINTSDFPGVIGGQVAFWAHKAFIASAESATEFLLRLLCEHSEGHGPRVWIDMEEPWLGAKTDKSKAYPADTEYCAVTELIAARAAHFNEVAVLIGRIEAVKVECET